MKEMFDTLKRALRKTDKVLLPVSLILSTISILMLMGLYYSNMLPGKRTIIMQIAAVTIGVVGAIILAVLDIDWLAPLWKLYLPPIIFLMLLTLFVGVQREGSENRSWLRIAGISIQPSEFLKIVFILSFAYHLSLVYEEINNLRVLIPVLIHGAVPIILILLQKDDGVAIIMMCIIITMLFVAGISKKYIIAGFIALPIVIPILWFFVLSDFQKRRFMVIWDRSIDPLNIGYQQLRGLTSMGSGRIFGNGIFTNDHISVPLNYNDFIYTFVGDSMGFVGCFLVIVLIAIICVRIIQIGYLCENPLGKFICAGVFAMIAFQTVINISMCLMLMPVIGVTLPFMSAGGSAALSNFAAVGLAMCIHKTNKKNMFDKDLYIDTGIKKTQ